MAITCKQCLLSNKIEGITIDENGLCDYCSGRRKDDWETHFNITPEKKLQLQQELDTLINQNRGKHKYDCVLALSGGKDSSYLLYHLVEERKLNVLAVHVNTHFENKLALKNINKLKSKINFTLKIVDPGKDFYVRFYRHLFNNPTKDGYIKTICYICGPLYLGFTLKVAAENNIPLVLVGLAPNQPENMFFEWGEEIIVKKHWIPDIFNTDEFDDDFKSKFWNPFEYPGGTKLPRLLAPLHVMNYNTTSIIKTLNDNHILPKKKLNPIATNCDLNWPMIYLDTKLHGYNPYVKEFASLVRRGETPRSFLKFLNFVVDYLIKFGLFKRNKIKQVEKKLDIRFSKCKHHLNSINRDFVDYP